MKEIEPISLIFLSMIAKLYFWDIEMMHLLRMLGYEVTKTVLDDEDSSISSLK